MKDARRVAMIGMVVIVEVVELQITIGMGAVVENVELFNMIGMVVLVGSVIRDGMKDIIGKDASVEYVRRCEMKPMSGMVANATSVGQ